MIKDYVVEFKLPSDSSLFIRHATNTCARNAREAIANVRPHIPDAFDFTADLGVVMLYGSPWATFDATRGAECAPADPAEQAASLDFYIEENQQEPTP